ncbi:MAG: 16S rRNA (guanine(527)-N(7))-methyltransferase RsmG [Thiotrichaceae bacterium]|nr:16S rRNA (guanine(527)-N(7))-methyltransferase RsmG [Thiotrichaceae bacterium]
MNQVTLSAGLVAMKVEANEHQLQQMESFVQLLLRWNKVFNLTAIKNYEEALVLHLFDSLSVAPYLKGERCLDVGAGGGLPGIPLAIMQPERYFTLVDAVSKKTRFMQQAVIELGLKNVTVIHSRIEKATLIAEYDAIISRAFASINDFVNLSGKYLQLGGSLYAMKGRYPESELKQLPSGFYVTEETTLHIPYKNIERILIEIKQNG